MEHAALASAPEQVERRGVDLAAASLLLVLLLLRCSVPHCLLSLLQPPLSNILSQNVKQGRRGPPLAPAASFKTRDGGGGARRSLSRLKRVESLKKNQKVLSCFFLSLPSTRKTEKRRAARAELSERGKEEEILSSPARAPQASFDLSISLSF